MHRRPHRKAHGQVAVIFGMVFLPAFAIAGLGVDSGTSYLQAAKELRAMASATVRR